MSENTQCALKNVEIDDMLDESEHKNEITSPKECEKISVVSFKSRETSREQISKSGILKKKTEGPKKKGRNIKQISYSRANSTVKEGHLRKFERQNTSIINEKDRNDQPSPSKMENLSISKHFVSSILKESCRNNSPIRLFPDLLCSNQCEIHE